MVWYGMDSHPAITVRVYSPRQGSGAQGSQKSKQGQQKRPMQCRMEYQYAERCRVAESTAQERGSKVNVRQIENNTTKGESCLAQSPVRRPVWGMKIGHKVWAVRGSRHAWGGRSTRLRSRASIVNDGVYLAKFQNVLGRYM